jgi:hypothetical protein
MPHFRLSSALLTALGLVAACQSKPKDSPTAAAQAMRPAGVKAKERLANSVVGTYRQAADSTDCDCDLAVTIWRAGHQLHYRIEDYPEQGLTTVDSTAGRRGLGFRSTPRQPGAAHEWSGSLEGDTLLVQTYGNAMNEYENFVGGCGCKFLTLIKQH